VARPVVSSDGLAARRSTLRARWVAGPTLLKLGHLVRSTREDVELCWRGSQISRGAKPAGSLGVGRCRSAGTPKGQTNGVGLGRMDRHHGSETPELARRRALVPTLPGALFPLLPVPSSAAPLCPVSLSSVDQTRCLIKALAVCA
jgi:hypothetical protein